MMLKALLLVPLSCLLLQTPLLEARSVVVQKSVSVKSPERLSSVIDHFNPAGHVYAASGSVIIDEEKNNEDRLKNKNSNTQFEASKLSFDTPRISSVNTVISPSTTTRFAAQSPLQSVKSFPSKSEFNLEKTVSVKSPARISSVIDHFNPAQHIYAATGNVKIAREGSQSPQPQVSTFHTTQQVNSKFTSEPVKVTKIVRPLFENHGESNINLEKSVSVKSPSRVTSVIDHFNPANHIFDAQGNVVINRVSSSTKPVTLQQEAPAPSKVTTFTKSETRKTFQPVAASHGSQLSLERTVSVKSPERVSAVIDHFTPAQHVYAATGNVKITREETPSPVLQSSTFLTTKHVTSKLSSEPAKVTKISAPVAVKLSQPIVNLEKAVSVKSPARVTSVVDHFNPANHIFDAQGNVVINRVASSTKPVTFQSAEVTPSKLTTFTKSETRKTFQPVVASHGSQLNLERTVSVKSPDRVSSVIDHFTPAQHIYAATGNVKITREETPLPVSQSSTVFTTKHVTSKLSSEPAKMTKIAAPVAVKLSQPIVNLEKAVSVKSPARVTSVVDHFNPANHIFDAQGNVVINRVASSTKPVSLQPAAPAALTTSIKSETRKTFQPVVASQGSQFNLEKSVSVKSPERVSSVIDHFTPAQHVYAATGNVKITREETPSPVSQSSTFLTTKHVTSKLSSEPAKVTKISAPVAVKLSQPNVNLEKTVSVKSPARVTSVVNNFNPVNHIDDTRSNVVINRVASSKPVMQKPAENSPSKFTSITNSVTRKTFQPVVVSHGSQLDLEKSVSVKSPERVSSVINHFTPAQHVYAATGNVKITQSGSRLNSGHIISPVKANSDVALVSSAHSFKPSSSINLISSNQKETVQTRVRTEPSKRVTQNVCTCGKDLSSQRNPFPSQAVDFHTIEKSTPTFITTKVTKSMKPISSDLNLERTVSVKSPDRVSSVIDHFNPAQHIYAATGNVVINRASSNQSPVQVQETLVSNSFAPKFTSLKSEKPAFVQPPQLKKVPAPSSDFNLEKSVSVNLPERQTSVINHFNPKGHQYAAQGNVVISRTPSPSLQKVVEVPVHQRIQPSVKSVTVVQERPVPAVSKLSSKPLTQPSKAGLSLEKSVSVNLPEHRISAIDHFNPAGHVYAATGNVKITRES